MTFQNAALASGFDRDLYEAINPMDLPRIGQSALTSSGLDGIYVDGDQQDRKFERYGAAFVDDADEVGLFGGVVGPAAYRSPPIFTAAITDAILIGYRTLLSQDLRFFTDEGYVDPELFERQLERISNPDPFANEKTGLRPAGSKSFFRFDAGARKHIRINGEAVVLSSDEPLSYGSFLFRILPKVKTLRSFGLTDLRCVLYAHPGPFRDLLTFCDLSPAKIIHQDHDAVIHIDRAIMPSMRNPDAYLDPESLDLYAELRARYGSRPTGRKIYISRDGLNKSGRGASRVMVNEPELIARLQGIGFDIIEPEGLSVKEQIMTFSSASVVVGPSGSGLFNTMFCHPATKIIDIQSEPQWIYSYTGMYSSLELDYGIFVGRADPLDTKPVHRKFSVNIEALVVRIRAFTGDAA